MAKDAGRKLKKINSNNKGTVFNTVKSLVMAGNKPYEQSMVAAHLLENINAESINLADSPQQVPGRNLSKTGRNAKTNLSYEPSNADDGNPNTLQIAINRYNNHSQQ